MSAPRGLAFPGPIRIPGIARSQEEKEERNRSAMAEALAWSHAPRTMWTDGSAVPSEGYAAAVANFEEGRGECDRISRERVVVRRGGSPEAKIRKTQIQENVWGSKKIC